MSLSIEHISKRIIPILIKHHISKAGIFGSVARGDNAVDSDIDLLVEVPSDISLLDFVGIKLELEDALNRKVDLVEYAALKQIIRENILKEQVPIL
mgnify:CR=1 FL=1|jgi:predicted nucleotidyltransferase